jgi:hypothetical protein
MRTSSPPFTIHSYVLHGRHRENCSLSMHCQGRHPITGCSPGQACAS